RPLSEMNYFCIKDDNEILATSIKQTLPTMIPHHPCALKEVTKSTVWHDAISAYCRHKWQRTCVFLWSDNTSWTTLQSTIAVECISYLLHPMRHL
uniref:Uncharacterized protein n=1 Tax=Parascaris univalens TaxID=6257 RepID=A0A914ZTQ9_PARUN